MKRRPPTPAVPELEGLDLLRLRRTVLLDDLPGIQGNAAVPAGGLVEALADELGIAVDGLPIAEARRANEAARQ